MVPAALKDDAVVRLDRRGHGRVVVSDECGARLVSKHVDRVSPASQIGVNEGARTRRLGVGFSCPRRSELRRQRQHRQLEQSLIAGKPFELMLAQVEQHNAR